MCLAGPAKGSGPPRSRAVRAALRRKGDGGAVVSGAAKSGA